jgi:hypothetical protein
MTEAEWLAATDPMPMEEFVRQTISPRKQRLCLCQCLHRLRHLLKDPRSWRAVELMEQFADGYVTRADLGRAREEARQALLLQKDQAEMTGETALAAAAYVCFVAQLDLEDRWFFKARPLQSEVDHIYRCNLLRDILNPFRLVILNPAWLTTTALALAQQMYDSRDFSPMPILADALQDGGCDNEDVLNHCRQPGEHTRGCWVVDLLLNKK